MTNPSDNLLAVFTSLFRDDKRSTLASALEALNNVVVFPGETCLGVPSITQPVLQKICPKFCGVPPLVDEVTALVAEQGGTTELIDFIC